MYDDNLMIGTQPIDLTNPNNPNDGPDPNWRVAIETHHQIQPVFDKNPSDQEAFNDELDAFKHTNSSSYYAIHRACGTKSIGFQGDESEKNNFGNIIDPDDPQGIRLKKFGLKEYIRRRR